MLVSSGAIAAGLAPLGSPSRPRDLATQQAAASVGQGLLVARYSAAFARHGLTVGQVLLTADDVIRRAHYRNAQRTLERLLGLGVVPVVNENDTVATEEIRFGDNDRLAALVAHLVGADPLVLLSDVDALYDDDPAQRTAAARPGSPRSGRPTTWPASGSARAAGRGVGTGGMATKVDAARIAAGAGVPVVLAHADQAAAALAGDDVGTCSTRPAPRAPARLLWLAHATTPRGGLVLDAGAVAAVVAAAYLAAAGGHHGGGGRVRRGRPGRPGRPGRSTRRPRAGRLRRRRAAGAARPVDPRARRRRWAAYSREVVHRDDLVLLS